MKNLLTTLLLTLLLINNANACSIDLSKSISYCDRGWSNSDRTEDLKIEAVCSVSEDAIAAQIELAQRYRDGYPTKRATIYYNGMMSPMAVSPSSYPCGEPDPEKEITPNQFMADYWAKFTSVTKVMLLAKNGYAAAQIELHRLYLGKGDEHDMINLFRDNFIIGIIENDKDIGIWWEPPNILIDPPSEFVLDTTF